MGEHIVVAAVDDHPVMLLGLRTALEATGDMRFTSTSAGVAGVREMDPRPDVVLLDLRLRDGSRPRDNVRTLLAMGCHVIVYTDGTRSSWVAEAVTGGAAGVVLKSNPPEALVEAIRTVRGGGTWISPELAGDLARGAVARPRLAPREVEVLQLVAQGLASKQVASRLGIKEETVKEYLKRIRAKYDGLGRTAATRVHLQQRAQEDGFLDPQPEG